jgi:hypothetical protein
MQKEKLRIYLAGKVSEDSWFWTSYRRGEVSDFLSEKTGYEIINLDPTQGSIDEADRKSVVGRDIYLIQHADVVICYLSDDISVGGSQELLIAKRYKKPVIGYWKKWGKFYQDKALYWRVYKDRKHPFVSFSCDLFVHTEDELITAVMHIQQQKIKSIDIIDETVAWYEDNVLENDAYVKKILQ